MCPKFKKTGKCTKHDAGTCPHKHPESQRGPPKGDSRRIPAEFFNKHAQATPAICLQFAYHGNCANNPNGDSCERNGKKYRHVCAKCEFKNGPHPISKGEGC